MGLYRLFLRAPEYCSVTVRGRPLNVPKSIGNLLRETIRNYAHGFPGSRAPKPGGIDSPPVPVLLSARRRHVARRFSTSTQIPKDVVLFEHDRTGFFRLLALFCGGQLLFWTYLAQFAYSGLRDTGKARRQATATLGFGSFEMNLGSDAWRYGFTTACLAVGGVIAGFGVLFCRRSVSRVVLRTGGRMVTVWTQSPLGPDRGRQITVPLAHVACHAHRHESPSFIPLRIKGHKFYFLLDKDGTLNNTKLFDVTVGAYRPF